MSELAIQPKIKLVIEFDPSTGQVNINGPINDRMFCYGVMELAKEAILAHAKAEQNKILVARPQMVMKQ